MDKRETLWERAKEEGHFVEEKTTGIRAKVIEIGGMLYLDDGSEYVSPVSEYTEDDFWIVNE